MPAKINQPTKPRRLGKAKAKIADLPDLMPHTIVADKLGVSTTILRTWITEGEFPKPHCVLRQTWFYRVDMIRTYMETGKWPDSAVFNRRRGGEE